MRAGEPIPSEEVSRRFAGDHRFVSDYRGIRVFTDVGRDDAGHLTWLRFSGRLLPALG